MNPVELKTSIIGSEQIGIEPIFFLQSREWEEFQRKLGRKTWRVQGRLLIKHNLPGGFHYLYCPRPTLITSNRLPVTSPDASLIKLTKEVGIQTLRRDLLAEAEKIARSEGSMFLKIDPVENLDISTFKNLKFQDSIFKDLKFKTKDLKFKVTTSLQPRSTVFLDLTKTEEELLGAMHPKTRYNIRVAQRSGVKITHEGGFEEFWNTLQETAEREQFFLHGREHYEALLSTASKDFSNELFFARAGGKTVAVLLVNFYRPGNAATYLHGASSRHSRGLMAPHLLHWHVVQEARRRGFLTYDFWGIDDTKWPGLTRFKKNFGGYAVTYPPSIDIVYRPFWYRVYNVSKKFKYLK